MKNNPKTWLWLLLLIIIAGLVWVIAGGKKYRGSDYKAEPASYGYDQNNSARNTKKSEADSAEMKTESGTIDQEIEGIDSIIESLDEDGLSDEYISNDTLGI